MNLNVLIVELFKMDQYLLPSRETIPMFQVLTFKKYQYRANKCEYIFLSGKL